MSPLVVENVVKHYRQGDRDVMALGGVSLDIPAGAFMAIMGASGSGKSTLLHLMAGLTQADSGSVRVDGQTLGAMNDKQLTLFRRRSIGLVFQAFNLIPTLTAEENIMLPLMLDGQSSAASEGKVNELLNLLGIHGRRGHRPDAMSGGEQQRVAIARAFVTEPKLLFADEPTGNLDAKTGRAMIDLLFELNRERGTTLILVTHDLSLAARCGRRLTIEEGIVSTEDEQAAMAM